MQLRSGKRVTVTNNSELKLRSGSELEYKPEKKTNPKVETYKKLEFFEKIELSTIIVSNSYSSEINIINKPENEIIVVNSKQKIIPERVFPNSYDRQVEYCGDKSIFKLLLKPFECPRFIIPYSEYFGSMFTEIVSFYLNILEVMSNTLLIDDPNENDNNVKLLFKRLTYINFIYNFVYDNRVNLRKHFSETKKDDRLIETMTNKATEIANTVSKTINSFEERNYVFGHDIFKSLANFIINFKNFKKIFNSETDQESFILRHEVVVSLKNKNVLIRPVQHIKNEGGDVSNLQVLELDSTYGFNYLINNLSNGQMKFSEVKETIKNQKAETKN